MRLAHLLEDRQWLSPALLAYWTLGAVFVGMMAASYVLPDGAPQSSADHSRHLTHDHAQPHGTLEVTTSPAPQVVLSVTKDAMSGWNLHAAVQNFAFAPDAVNSASPQVEGHGHIYVNGEKIARLYGPYYHLSDLEPGTNSIRVTLNSNTHQTFTVAAP